MILIMKTIIAIIAITAQNPPAIIDANNAATPAQMNSHTATTNAQNKIKIPQPTGEHKQIRVKITNANNIFFISV